MKEKIQKHFELQRQIKLLEEEDELLKSEIKSELQLKGLDFFEDESGNTVSYKEQVRESLDKSVIKSYLTPEQFQSAVKTTQYGVLKILSKESRDAIKKSFKRQSEE